VLPIPKNTRQAEEEEARLERKIFEDEIRRDMVLRMRLRGQAVLRSVWMPLLKAAFLVRVRRV
jgi:hypothetical protein